jgi:hypothetical protein
MKRDKPPMVGAATGQPERLSSLAALLQRLHRTPALQLVPELKADDDDDSTTAPPGRPLPALEQGPQ